MKYINIEIKYMDCEYIYAYGTVYNCNREEEIRKEIEYPVNSTKAEIAEIFIPTMAGDYSVKVGWIGGRPNDRA